MKQWHKFLVVFTASLLLVALLIPTVYADPPAQDPRPPGESGGGGGGGDGDGGGDGNGQAAITCASVQGQVINWGVGGMSSVGVQLQSGSWQVSALSDNEGNYAFGGLGVGVARLQVTLPPAMADTLQPLVQDAGVYLNCDFQYVANLALYSGSRIDPPASIEMSAPASLTPGENTVIRLLVKNDLPTEISQVVVTDLMPAGLTALEAKAATVNGDNVQLIDGGPDGQLVVVFLDRMAPGTEENILITVAVAEDLAIGDQIRNTATLFYKESAADQAWVDFTVGPEEVPLPMTEPLTTTATTEPDLAAAEAEATEPAATATTRPAATPAAVEISPAEPTAEADEAAEFVPPPAMPQTGEELLPPPAAMPVAGEELLPPPMMLPETGDTALPPPALLPETGAGPLLPLAGLGLGSLAFVAHYLRSSRQKRK